MIQAIFCFNRANCIKNENADFLSTIDFTLIRLTDVRVVYQISCSLKNEILCFHATLKGKSKGKKYFEQCQLVLGTIHILRQYNFGLFLTHYVNINTVRNVSKTGLFQTRPHSPLADVIYRWSFAENCVSRSNKKGNLYLPLGN